MLRGTEGIPSVQVFAGYSWQWLHRRITEMRSSRPPKPNWNAQIDGLTSANKSNEVAITIPLYIGRAFSHLGVTQPLTNSHFIFTEGHAVVVTLMVAIAFATDTLWIVLGQ
jgi:hypothetical protein